MKEGAEVRWSEMTERERDALVAERVMGWSRVHGNEWLNSAGKLMIRPGRFSTDIAAAWQVVERMHKNYWVASVSNPLPDDNEGEGDWVSASFFDGMGIFDARMDTAPAAICLAALRACGVDIEP